MRSFGRYQLNKVKESLFEGNERRDNVSVLIFKVGLNQVTLGAKLLLIDLWL